MNTSPKIIELGDVSIEIHYKNIKNVHLSVHPPNGRVTLSSPLLMEYEALRLFCISKIRWIRNQQKKLLNQRREAPREYVNKESHYFLGHRYLLNIKENIDKIGIVLKKTTIDLYIRPNSTRDQRDEMLQIWYREQLRKVVSPLIAKYEKKMHIKVEKILVRKMKTKWGSCKPESKEIILNTELAKKPIESIEYILVHEMTHILERGHNEKFISILNKYLPNWEHVRTELNRSALGHVEWNY